MTDIDTTIQWTPVERAFLMRQERPSSNQIPTLVISEGGVQECMSFLVLKCLEFISEHPNAVICLPTEGTIASLFVKALKQIKDDWSKIVEKYHLEDSSLQSFPDTSQLTLVSAYTLLHPTINTLSKHQTVIRELCQLLNLTSKTQVLQLGAGEFEMQLDASTEEQQSICRKFSQAIQSKGGIGLYVSCLGPTGQIGMIPSTSTDDSTCILPELDYSLAASLAGDFGGIEGAKQCQVATVGLQDFSDTASILLVALGQGQAEVVRNLVESNSSTVNSFLKHSDHTKAKTKLYCTQGAASSLRGRKVQNILQLNDENDDWKEWATQHIQEIQQESSSKTKSNLHLEEPPDAYVTLESFMYDVSLDLEIPVADLQPSTHISEYLRRHKIDEDLSSVLTEPAFQILQECAVARLKCKVEAGLSAMSASSKTILHTAPHHDDILLSYHACLHELLGNPQSSQSQSNNNTSNNNNPNSEPAGEAVTNHNENHFAYLTSGFNSVPDRYLEGWVQGVRGSDGNYTLLTRAATNWDLQKPYDDLLKDFVNAVNGKDTIEQGRIEHVIFLRNVAVVFEILHENQDTFMKSIQETVELLRTDYLTGQTDAELTKKAKLIKGCMRESEVDRVWALSHQKNERVHHLRSKFYMEKQPPTREDDAVPVANLIQSLQPHWLTVAFDPEGTGPDTHYKVLQIVAEGIRVALERGDISNAIDFVVWGYRNVWFTFTPSEATLLMPVTQADLDLMDDTFMNCFTTQKDASFPSPLYDGPFSAWSRHLQQQQYLDMQTLLGEEYLQSHPDRRVQEAAGFVFVQAMSVDRFLKEVDGLKSTIEA